MTASVPAESNERTGERTGSRTFPRNARLLRHADFERVYKQGRKHFSPSITVFYLVRQAIPEGLKGSKGLRIGFTVGRALGGAVHRNRMKRRLREAVRLSRPWPAADVDVVINPKKVVRTMQFDALLNEVCQAFVVIEKKLAKVREGGSGSRKPEGQAS
ncbi:MAG TPA: ribonuclease P protein component [Candidatus Eisenbacteria bacterium]|nr:ribonuclease P protein component [Candidatus Eisenbacteria bacterium]